MRVFSSVILCLVAGLALPGRAATCPGGQGLGKFADKPIMLADDTLFFATSTLEVDVDGSPSAYGLRDQGLDSICSGLAPLQPPACRGTVKGRECATACNTAFAAWSQGGGRPETLKASMCSVGLGGGRCSEPQVRLQAAPRQEWFVSETSVRLRAPDGESIAGWTGQQAAQLDATLIPYFVIPGGFRKLPWDATPGDAGILLDAASGRTAAFVVGDTGGALDEASVALHAAIRNGAPHLTPRTSALGETVQSYLSGMSGDFRVAIFRHTASRKGATLALTATTLGPWIAEHAAAGLARVGGVARLRACTGG